MQFETQLELLHRKFISDLAERFRQIEELYRQPNSDKDALRQALHRLVGLAGIFKADRVSEIARTLELHYAQPAKASPTEQEKIIEILFAQLEKAVRHHLSHYEKPLEPQPAAPALAQTEQKVCLVEDDPLQAEKMALALQEAGYQVVVHNALPPFTEFMTGARQLPALVIMDIMFTGDGCTGDNAIRQLRQHIGNFPPIVFVSVLSDAQSRINAIRAGASDYLVKPFANEALVTVADKYLRKPKAYKLLIVDDDAISAEYIAAVITQAGMQAKVQTDPMRVFDELETFQPDLLILDIYMPGCTGIELAQAIRQCCCHSLMPIIFLTTDTQIDQELAALNSGGDEFIRKTDSSQYLLQKLESRLRRLDQIREINQQLQQATQRAEFLRKSQSDFLAYVAHELKSPLHVMQGFAELLKMDTELNDDQADMVNEIIKSGKKQLAIIMELAEQAKIAAGKITLKIETLDLNSLLTDAINNARLLGQNKNISVTGRFDADQALTVKADRHRLEQVLANLLSNAIKYNNDNGSIWVSTQKRSNGLLRINVRDNGIGIADDKLDYVFDAFERLGAQQSAIEGSGIGLSICKQLIHLMGGHIGVESELNNGSHFWIELPF